MSVLEQIDADAWLGIPGPGVWSPGKDAEHVADGSVLHQWSVRLTVGQAKASAKPAVERRQLTSRGSQAETIELIRRTLDEAASFIRGLTDAQLDLATKPARARARSLAETIEGMIGHVDRHRAEIESKLRRRAAR